VQERTAAHRNIHYKDENDVLSMNSNEDFVIKEADLSTRDAFATTNPGSSKEGLYEIFDKAVRANRKDDDEARTKHKLWVLLKRQLSNDIRQKNGEIR
jgi:CRISPR/Cas system CSM-associated protein Csm2 small subunit